MSKNYLDYLGLEHFWTKLKFKLSNKVDKIDGKGLSTNDYTNEDKNKLSGIENNANNYSLPVATSSILGGIKSGGSISIDSNGLASIISVPESSVKYENSLPMLGGYFRPLDSIHGRAHDRLEGLPNECYIWEKSDDEGTTWTEVSSSPIPKCSSLTQRVRVTISCYYNDKIYLYGRLKKIGLDVTGTFDLLIEAIDYDGTVSKSESVAGVNGGSAYNYVYFSITIGNNTLPGSNSVKIRITGTPKAIPSWSDAHFTRISFIMPQCWKYPTIMARDGGHAYTMTRDVTSDKQNVLFTGIESIKLNGVNLTTITDVTNITDTKRNIYNGDFRVDQSSSDWNSLTTPGTYYINAGSTGKLLALNGPDTIAGYGILVVEQSNTILVQTYYPHSNSAKSTFTRTKFGNTWELWRRFYDSAEISDYTYSKSASDGRYLNTVNSTQQRMSTTNIITNLNADLIDGYHSIEQFKLGNCNPESTGPAFGRNAFNGDRTSIALGNSAYNQQSNSTVIGAAAIIRKSSHNLVDFLVGDSTDIQYCVTINLNESLVITVNGVPQTITNTSSAEQHIIVIAADTAYDPVVEPIYRESESYIDIFISGILPRTNGLMSVTKVTIDGTVFSILSLRHHSEVMYDLIDSTTTIWCATKSDRLYTDDYSYSTAINYGATAARFSVAIGRQAYAYGFSTAIGRNANASDTSVVIGNYNYATASTNTIIGYNNYASVRSSLLIGADLMTAGTYRQVRLGYGNELEYRVFSVSDGTSTNRRDLLYYQYGGIYISNSGITAGNAPSTHLTLKSFSSGTTAGINLKAATGDYALTYAGVATTYISKSVSKFEVISSNNLYAVRVLELINYVSDQLTPIKTSLDNKVDKSEIDLGPVTFDVTYDLGSATTSESTYVKLFSVKNGYAVELLIAILGPFGTYTLENCVANCAYYPSITTDSTKLYYQNKLPSDTVANFLMKLQPMGYHYPNQKIRLKLTKAFRSDNSPVDDIYSAIIWGDGTKLTNVDVISGHTLRYIPEPSNPDTYSSIINLTQSNIDNSEVTIDISQSTSWFVKTDVDDSIDSILNIKSTNFPVAGTKIDFIFDLDLPDGMNLSSNNLVVASYPNPLYKGDKLTFIVPESGDDWYVKLTPVAIMSTSLVVNTDDFGRTSIDAIPISDDKIVACCVL